MSNDTYDLGVLDLMRDEASVDIGTYGYTPDGDDEVQYLQFLNPTSDPTVLFNTGIFWREPTVTDDPEELRFRSVPKQLVPTLVEVFMNFEGLHPEYLEDMDNSGQRWGRDYLIEYATKVYEQRYGVAFSE